MSGARERRPGRRSGGPGPSRVAPAATLLATLLTGALTGLTGLAAPAAAAGTAPAAPAVAPAVSPAALAATDDPLSVSIDTVGPAALPESGPLVVTGSVTNDGIETWEDVNVYALFSPAPMTTSAELAEAAALPADAVVGERVTEPGAFAEVGDLAPGTTRSFAVRVPNDDLPAAGDGVHWLGLQALGADSSGRDDVADGRARTFVPRVTDAGAGEQVDTALVVPLRHPVRRDTEGRVRNLGIWAEDLGPGGRLDRLLDFAAESDSAPGTTVNWLLDPAVPDTVAELVAGNDGLSIAPSTTPGGGDGEQDGDTGDDGGSDGPSPSGGADDDASATPEADPEQAALQARAARAGGVWLEQMRSVLGSDPVLALPYGDLDVDASVRAGAGFHERARERSDEVVAAQGLEDAEPVVAPPSGYLDPRTLAALPRTETPMVADTALATPTDASLVRVEGRDVAVSSAGAARGGPDVDPLAPVAVRQRLVSEAALRLVAARTGTGDDDPSLVVTMPSTWDPTPGTGFFRSLAEVDWLDLTSLDQALGGTTPTVTTGSRADAEAESDGLGADALTYPDTQRASEIRPGTMAAADRLVGDAGTLQDVLPLNDTVARQAADDALVAMSYANRADPAVADRAVRRTGGMVTDMLGAIEIDAPTSLTLSAENGDFSVQLSNGLDQPVVVRLRAVTDGPLEIRAPEQVEVPPEAGTTVRMPVQSSRVGLSNVEVELIDSRGNALGSSDTLPVRAVQIGDVIWWILGTGSALLFTAILLRLVRRVRASRRAATG